MGQIQWTVSLVMLGLFVVAVLGFAINFADDNNAVIDISDDFETSQLYTNTTANISTFGSEAKSTTTSILNTTIPAGSQTAESSGGFAITTANLMGVLTNVLGLGYKKIFGSNPDFAIFFFALIGLVGLISILYVWKTLAGRNPE